MMFIPFLSATLGIKFLVSSPLHPSLGTCRYDLMWSPKDLCGKVLKSSFFFKELLVWQEEGATSLGPFKSNSSPLTFRAVSKMAR